MNLGPGYLNYRESIDENKRIDEFIKVNGSMNNINVLKNVGHTVSEWQI